jgi:hypothetical protein
VQEETQNEASELLDSIRTQALDTLNKINAINAQYLTNLPKNKNVRNMGAILACLRLALDFTQSKPAQAVALSAPGGGPVQSAVNVTIQYSDKASLSCKEIAS